MATLLLGCVGIPEFVVASIDYTNPDIHKLVISGLPTDGSIALAYVSMGTIGTWTNGVTTFDRHLIAFTGTSSSSSATGRDASVSPPENDAFHFPAGWSVLA